MRNQLRLGSGLNWAVAWILAVGAGVLYLVAPGTATWWLACVLVAPLILLVLVRLPDGSGGGGSDGPFGPPSDFGGGSHGH